MYYYKHVQTYSYTPIYPDYHKFHLTVTKLLSSVSVNVIGVFFTQKLLTSAHYFPKHALSILKIPLIGNS